MPAERIILIGYRGSGKTTVGQLLAARLGWAFADTDAAIEAAAGRSIADIFATEQEAGFRDREAAIVQQLCQRPRLVLATGGGVVLRPANRTVLRSAGFVVWLQVSAEVAWSRLQADRLEDAGLLVVSGVGVERQHRRKAVLAAVDLVERRDAADQDIAMATVVAGGSQVERLRSSAFVRAPIGR